MNTQSDYDFDIDALSALAGGAFKASALLNLRVREMVIENGPKPSREGMPGLIAQAIAEMREGSITLTPEGDDAIEDAERSKKVLNAKLASKRR